MRLLAAAALAGLALPATDLLAQGGTRTTVVETVAGASAADSEATPQAHDVRFRKDSHDRMTVPVSFSGNGPFRFLVDTGSDRTAISRELAARLGLIAGEGANLHSVTGSSRVATAKLPPLQLNRREIHLSDAPLLESANMGADGILGLDSLRSQRVLFDFKQQKMTIIPSVNRALPDEKDSIVVRARQRNGRLVITKADANGIPVMIVIDTGAEVSVGNEALRRRLEEKKGLRPSGRISLISVTGERLFGDYMFLKNLDLGNVEINRLGIVFTDAYIFRELDLQDRPALLLGMNAMRGFEKVAIDFAKKQMRVIMPERSALEGPVMAARAVEAR